MRKNKTNKKIIFSVFFFIVFLSINVVANYMNGERKEELFNLRREYKTNATLPSNEQLIEKKKSLDSKIAEVKSHLFESDNPIFFIEQIESMAESSNLVISIDNTDFVKNENDESGEIKATISVTGELFDLEKFLFDIESSSKEIYVKSVKISLIEIEEGFTWRGVFNIVSTTL